MLKRCSKCVLPETYPGITFDQHHVCNHCRTRRKYRTHGFQALKQAIDAHTSSSSGQYDCMVALSGGQDSSYTAYYATTELSLRPLLYTFDNGEMPEQTRENIDRLASILGLDHVTTTSDQVHKCAKHIMSCWLHRPSAAMIGLLCTGCRTGYRQGLAETVRKHGIRFILSGGGEPTQSFAQRLLSTGQSRNRRLPMLFGLAREWIRNPRYISSPTFVRALGTEFYYRFFYDRSAEATMLPIFRFIEWNEENIVSTIQDQLGWRKPAFSQSTWRSDCKISQFKDYLHLQMVGFNQQDEAISAKIRCGQISRQAALQKLANVSKTSQQFLVEMCQELELDYRELERALDTYGITSAERAHH